MIDTPALANDLQAAGMDRRQAETFADHLNRALQAGSVTLPADMAEVKAELRFRRWAFASIIGLEIALVLRAFVPAT